MSSVSTREALRKGPRLRPRQVFRLGDLAYLPLEDGENPRYTVIDWNDVELLGASRWHLDGQGYATAKQQGKHVKLHNLILPCAGTPDHVNRDRLDNRRSNLREATPSQSRANRSFPLGKSGYRGVRAENNRWVARIKKDGLESHLGSFGSPEEAARAYDRSAIEKHGEFAVVNFKDII